MAKYEIRGGEVVYTDKGCGAILLDDELWHPFRYFDDGELDVDDAAYTKPSEAFDMAQKIFT